MQGKDTTVEVYKLLFVMKQPQPNAKIGMYINNTLGRLCKINSLILFCLSLSLLSEAFKANFVL